MKSDSTSEPTPMPGELENALKLSDRLKTRFEILSKEKQQSYIDYVSAAKEGADREERVETCIPYIMKLRDAEELED